MKLTTEFKKIQILTQGLKLRIQIILKFIDEDSDFSDSEINKLEYLEYIVDNLGCRLFQLQSLTALENVSLEFMDTPFENQITDFKQSIIRNYKCFDEWFTKHSISDWYVFLKKRKNFHRSTEMIFFYKIQ